ncbi:putative cytochrome P450 [Lophiotrema nucula]|uniref:Putative cytochrome P450 n=1 Tax=Lophiotrema nucula TaxID=690887 RepID=A0A6A5YJP4_9PLEO|nr:putative cytochrome P450 [Lophiotrema nucula]
MSSVIPHIPGAVQVVIAAIALFTIRYFSTATEYARVGNSRIWTWIPKTIPMRYELDRVSKNAYASINKKLDQPFVMKFFGYDYVMLQPKYLVDLKRAAASAMSFNVSFSDAFNLGSTVGDLYFSDNMGLAVTNYLNRQLKTFVPALVDEVEYALQVEVGRPAEWKTVTAAKVNGILIHRVTNRVIVGQRLCRDEEFSQTSLRFTSTLLPAAVWTNFISFGPLRDLASRATTFFHKWELEASLKLLIPEVERRLRESTEKASSANDSIQWLIEIAEKSNDPQEMIPRRIAENILHLLFAANSAPGALVTQMMYESLMNPAYLDILRAEIDGATGSAKEWTAVALDKMPFLDSFVRETLRVYPPGSIACTRTIMNQPYTLHDDTVLPLGSRVAFPVLAIQTDPENYDNPQRFNPYRFVKVSERGAIMNSTVLSSTLTTSFLTFGYGKHACPGRFFGIVEAKLVFGKLVQEYDIQWAKATAIRPPNVSIEGMVPPNQDALVKLRTRTA